MHQFIGLYYVAIFCLLVPYMALKQKYGKKTDRPIPPRNKLQVLTLVNLAIFGGFALLVANSNHLEVFPTWNPGALELMVGLAMLIFWLALRFILLEWLRADADKKTSRLLPIATQELPVWILISLFAGFFEEICYRCVLFLSLFFLTGSFLVAGLVASLAFAVAHIRQGPRAAGFTFFFAVSFQLFYYQTGTLYTLMIVHTLYDLIVGISYLRERLAKSAPSPDDSEARAQS